MVFWDIFYGLRPGPKRPRGDLTRTGQAGLPYFHRGLSPALRIKPESLTPASFQSAKNPGDDCADSQKAPVDARVPEVVAALQFDGGGPRDRGHRKQRRVPIDSPVLPVRWSEEFRILPVFVFFLVLIIFRAVRIGQRTSSQSWENENIFKII